MNAIYIFFFIITVVNKLILDRKQSIKQTNKQTNKQLNKQFYKYRPRLHLTPLRFELQELSSYYLAPNWGMMIMMYYFVAWAFSFFPIQSYNIAQRCILITNLVWWVAFECVVVQQLFILKFDTLELAKPESSVPKISKATVSFR